MVENLQIQRTKRHSTSLELTLWPRVAETTSFHRQRYAAFYPETISSTPRELCQSQNLTKFAATPTSPIEILSPRT